MLLGANQQTGFNLFPRAARRGAKPCYEQGTQFVLRRFEFVFAYQVAQFLKRVGFLNFRANAQDEAEAYAMRMKNRA